MISTRGDTHLGGEDIDVALMKYCMDDLESNHGIDLQENKRAQARLRKQCREVKHTLSAAVNATIAVESIVNDIDYDIEITRTKFEQLCSNIFERCLLPVRDAL